MSIHLPDGRVHVIPATERGHIIENFAVGTVETPLGASLGVRLNGVTYAMPPDPANIRQFANVIASEAEIIASRLERAVSAPKAQKAHTT